MIILYCHHSNNTNIWILLFVAFFSVVVSIIGNWVVARYGNVKKIKDEITENCDKLIVLYVTLYKFIAMSHLHDLLVENNIDKKQLLESESIKFRDKFIDADNDKDFLLSKLRQLNHRLFNYYFQKEIALKIATEINNIDYKDSKTFSFISNLVKDCAKDIKKRDTLNTDIAKFVINEGNGKPLKEILALFKFRITSKNRPEDTSQVK